MLDVIFVAVTVVFFGLAVAYVIACEQLGVWPRSPKGGPDPRT
jgi:hypothetical protein